ncbi:MAG: calcium/sodium antiporter [Gammaproteobacteria bacterium]
MLLESLAVVVGLVLLGVGADRFVLGASALARHLGVAPLIIGLTIVGIATSMPEVLVSSLAAWQGRIDIAIGNAIGSNIANVALVLGATTLFIPIAISSHAVKREFMLMLAAILIAGLLLANLQLSRLDGLILLAGLIASLYLMVRMARGPQQNDPLFTETAQEYEHAVSYARAWVYFLLGLLVLLGGAELLVRGAIGIAKSFGISDLVIGLTIVAVGTSLPELAASIASVIKKEADLAIGNIVGSNMFNMWAVLGIPALLRPGQFEAAVMTRDYPIMLALSLVFAWLLFGRGNRAIGRGAGVVLFSCFCAYQAWLFMAPATL